MHLPPAASTNAADMIGIRAKSGMFGLRKLPEHAYAYEDADHSKQ